MKMDPEDVVISGISGRFPNCDNLEELAEALFRGDNLVSEEGRWEAGEMNVPHQVGKLTDPYVFDLTFFGIHRKLAEYMDPHVKLVLENSIAAVIDAGLSLNEIIGSNTASIVNTSLCETEYECLLTCHRMDQNILSHSPCMQSNRLAYFLDLKGPSFITNSSWNGGMFSLQYAIGMITRGEVDSALVAASSILFLPQVSYHYDRLGRLNKDGKTKCFSDDADGYSRSESCVVFLLQRRKDARRVYGTLRGVEAYFHGSKEGSLTDCSVFDSGLLKRIYEQTKVDPSSISYLEASGCASKVVDAKELNVVSEVLLPNRKGPLLIGSVKSNLGHTETASAFLGIVKSLIAAERNLIPANLHYSEPNKLVPALLSGELKVVTETTPLDGDIVAVSNMSAFGEYSHVIIERNLKEKNRKCQVGVLPPDGIPRIVMLSAREENSLNKIMDKVEAMPIDEEFIALTHKTFGRGIKGHGYRGYTVLHEDETSQKYRQIKPFPGGDPRPLWIVFAGMGSQWPGMAKDLMKLPTFAKSIQFCHDTLVPFDIDLIDVITNPDPKTFDNILNCFLGIAAVQVGLVDILKEVGLEADGLVGHSLGELGCAYYDGSFTAEQMIMAAYYRGKISADSGITDGLMAAVGKGYQYLKDKVPEGIDIACRNSSTSCTISGPATLVEEYIDELAKQGVFVRSVPSGQIAYHSRYIQRLGAPFLEALKKLVPNPKPRSSKWISTSVPEENWNNESALLSSAEYHTNNLLSPVLFEEAMEHIPSDAIILEVAPRGLLQAILKRALPNATYISLAAKENNSHLGLISTFGKLYNEGISVNVENFYPPVEFPVSRGTPTLSNFLTWIHNESWTNWEFIKKTKEVFTTRDILFNNINECKYNTFANYTLNESPFVSPSAYLDIIIETLYKVKKETITKITIKDINFENVLIYGGDKPVRVSLQEGSGYWEFSTENERLASAIIEISYNKLISRDEPSTIDANTIGQCDLYSYLSEMGLSVSNNFQNVQTISICQSSNNFAQAEILWKCDWFAFIDSIFVFITFFNTYFKNKLNLVERIKQLSIDFDLFDMGNEKIIKLYYNGTTGLLWGEGIELLHPTTKEPNFVPPTLKEQEFLVSKFVPFQDNEDCNVEYSDIVKLCVNVALNNRPLKTSKFYAFTLFNDVKNQNEINSIFNKQESDTVILTSLPDDSSLAYTQNIDMKQNYCIIFNESNLIDNSLKTLENCEEGFLFCNVKDTPANLTCVLSQKCGTDTYYLYKTVKKFSHPPDYVLMATDNWKTDLIGKLDKDNNRIVYLAGYYTSVNFIYELVEKLSTLENSQLLRYIFLDNKSSLYKLDMFKDQLSKDLRVNILQNGKWGTHILTPLDLSSSLDKTIKNSTRVYKFQDIKTNGISLASLGLNTTGVMEDDKLLGVFEYSGLKDAKPICGLATINDETVTLVADDIFIWDKPKKWTYEESTSSILVYTMAYYLFDMECQHYDIEKVLVCNGELPLSQAIIRIALKKGYEVFTTYIGGKADKKELIKRLYPEIPESNIFETSTQMYDQIMLQTNGKGVSLVVNTSNDTRMISTLFQSLGNFGQYFQVNFEEVTPEVKIGMRNFLQSTSINSFGPYTLLKLNKEDKEHLRELVNSGFKNNEVVPISSKFLPLSYFNTEAFNLMKNENESHNKFIVKIRETPATNDTNKRLIYSCDSKKIFIILGDENLIWFDLIESLISRGAKRFIVLVNNISPLLSQRLAVLLNHNESVHISLESIYKVKEAYRAEYFIKQTEEAGKIQTLFVFGKDYCKVFEEISDNLKVGHVVFIGKSGMNRNGISPSCKSLFVNVPNETCDLRSFVENLDSLLQTTERVIYLTEFTSREQKSAKSTLNTLLKWQHLPDTLEDIAYLASSSGAAAEWKELRTCGLQQSNNKDIDPLFVMPPLRKGQIDKLIRSIFYPAFVAVIPQKFNDFEELAGQLYKDLERFDCAVYNLVCTNWCYMLGIALGRILEKNGKVVSLILLDVNTSWADLTVVNRIHTNIINNLSVSNIQIPERTKELFENGLEILKHRITTVCDSRLPLPPQYQGLCQVIVGEEPEETVLNQLSQYCKRPVKVHNLCKGDFMEMVNSSEAANLINSIVIVGHKDSARPVTRDYEYVKIVVGD